jgi:hypothetical protein
MQSLDGPPKCFVMPLYPQRRDRDCYFEPTCRGLLTVFHLVNAANPREAAVEGREVRVPPEKT